MQRARRALTARCLVCRGFCAPSSRLEQLRKRLAEDKGATPAGFADPSAAARPKPAPAAPPPDTASLPPQDPAQRLRALALYRRLLRAARAVPTQHRRDYIARRTRGEFEDARWERDAERVQFLLEVGETHLDTVLVQAQHLASQVGDPRYAAQWRHEAD